MASRLVMHEELCTILGTRNVYFQPPESLKMKYPCIRYSVSGINTKHGDDKNYLSTKQYELVVIDSNADSTIPDSILNHFSKSKYDRSYEADNLYHHILTIYY